MLHGINDLRYEEAPPLPETVAPGAVRVAIKAVGICRSDVHYLQKVPDLLDVHASRQISTVTSHAWSPQRNSCWLMCVGAAAATAQSSSSSGPLLCLECFK